MIRRQVLHRGSVRVWFCLGLIMGGGAAQTLALETPALSSGVGSVTVPPTTYESETVSVNPSAEADGNLMVTGNVSGGKHFQSTVPYRDSSRLQTSLGSTHLDNFYRLSEASEQTPIDATGYVPYFSKSATTTRMSLYDNEPVSTLQATYERDSTSRPADMQQLGNYRFTTSAASMAQQSRWPVTQVMQQWREQLLRDQGPDVSSETWARFVASKNQEVATEELFTTPLTPLPWTAKTLERPFKKDLSPAAMERPWEATVFDSDRQEGQETELAAKGLKGKPAYDPVPWQAQPPDISSEAYALEGVPDLEIEPELLAKSSVDRRADAAAQLRSHMAQGEFFLQRGKYSEAADAFTLATQVNPEHAPALAGKSYALLAQGEFMSSALFLGRALENKPDYASYRSILKVLTSEPLIKDRLQAAKVFLATVPAPELLFLMGYMHYQLGDLGMARTYLRQAQSGAKPIPGLNILLRAVEKRIAGG